MNMLCKRFMTYLPAASRLLSGCMLAAITLLSASCREQVEDIVTDMPQGTVRFGIVTTADTKAGVVNYNTGEAAVNNWAVLVFNSDGLVVFRKAGMVSNEHPEHQFLTGTYQVRAVANFPTSGSYAFNVNNIKNLSQFNVATVGLQDNSIGSFVMAGTTVAAGSVPAGSFVVNETSDSEVNEVSVRLRRLVSKIDLKSVKLDFISEPLRTKDVLLKNVFLTNLYPVSRYSSDFSVFELSSSQSSWYNCMGWHKEGGASTVADIDALTSDIGININLIKNGTTSLNRNYYFYPNPMSISDDSHEADWTGARCSRLILEVVIEGRTYYYQCNLPLDDANVPIGRNCLYNVSCILKNLGSRDPEQIIPGSMETVFDVVVIDGWNDSYSPINEES